MSYRIILHDRLFNPLTTLTESNFWDLEYSNVLDKAGTASFKIRVRDVKATTANLKLFNRVKIYKGSLYKFTGYISKLSVTLNEIDVDCVGILNVFKDRNISYATTIGQTLTNEFYKLLNILVNGVDDTGIDQGSSTAISTLNQRIYFRDTDALSAFQKLAKLENKVININENNQLDLVDNIGTDKSNTIIFKYIIDQIATANIFEYDVDVDSKDMANYVIGKTNGGITAVKQDALSIAEFGLIREVMNNVESSSATQLNAEAQTYLDNHKYEMITPNIKPNSLKIDPDSYDIGDIIRVVLDNGFIALNKKYKIIEKKTKVSSSGIDENDIKVTPEGSNILPSNFFEDIADLKRRQSLIEGFILE